MRMLVYLLLILPALLLGQNQGDTHRKSGDLDKAIVAYKTQFYKIPNDYKNTYNLACTFALLYQKDSAFHYLKYALKNDNSLWALADNDLLPLTDDQRWNVIEAQQMTKYQQHHTPITKPKYALQLLALIMKDQALDYQMDMAKDFYRKHGKIPHWYYPLAAMKQQISKENFSKMQSLIVQNGWPTYNAVGKIAADGPLLIINHHKDDAVRVQYLAQIKQACLNKQGSCIEFAKIQDRILVNAGKPQLYGMQFRYNANRKLVPFPIQDPEYVDQRRAAIGLESLQKYLKRKINYNWIVAQKK